ncbi:MAG TPA: 3-hydroxyacyl-ACP dehydratase FabZ family protein [Verrucomicrobiae bacterium]|nr:3-hydroxyacyl-ACP dehydratase FabZ family protein [Verrucomicrobiae bacterium]
MNHDDLQAALRALPHGPEFRFVDRITRLEPGKAGAGEYTVRGDEPFLRGHFPGDPLMPGVLLVEAGAQLAGVVAQSDPIVGPLPGLKLTALRTVKILGAARPGEVLHIEAVVNGRLGHLIQAQAKVTVGGVLYLSAEITLAGTTA